MNKNEKKVCFKDIAIVGAGAAGLMCAAALKEAGGRAVILEGSGRAGVKLLMAGNGQCNLTHGGLARILCSTTAITADISEGYCRNTIISASAVLWKALGYLLRKGKTERSSPLP